MKRKLPKSVRKHIREEKARIRRGALDLKEQKKMIDELYSKFISSPDSENKKDSTVSKKEKVLSKK